MKTPIDMQAGAIHKTNNFGDIEILKYRNYSNVDIMFKLTNSNAIARADHIRNGTIKDKMSPTVYGVGFIGAGNHKPFLKGKDTKKYKVWSGMLERCYCEKYKSKHPTYEDCTVSSEWLNFQLFSEWFDNNYIDGYQLDKDIKIDGNKIYSKETCLFVSKKDNIIKAKAGTFNFISPNGVEVEIYNMTQFSKDNGLCNKMMSLVHLEKLSSHNGWKKA